MNTRIISILLLVSLAYGISAQQEPCTTIHTTNFFPVNHDATAEIAQIQKDWEVQLQDDITNLEKPFLKEMQYAMEQRMVYKSDLLKSEAFLFYDDLQNKIDSLAQRLLDSNEIIKEERIRFLLFRSPSPNASCLGEGTILINLGLLNRLQSTEQLAFIMAHELAHYHLDHVNQSIFQRVTFLNEKTTKQKIKAARKGKVLANSELNEWMGTNRLNLSKHSRENELETDSLGIIFHLNAGFTPEAASSALQLLEGIDQAKYSLPNLESFFDFASYPWQARWGKSSLKGLSLHKPEQEEDERLRTHPDLTRRIEQAQRMVSSKSHFVGNNDLCTWHDLLEIDLLKYQYKKRSYFFTLLQSLKILGQNPKHRYAKAIVAHCLIDLCLTRKRHEFSKIVPAPNIKMDNDIFRLVTFLDNLSYSELKQVATHWGKAVLPVIKEEEIANGLTLKLEALSMDFIELPVAKEFKQSWPGSIYYRF